MTKTSAFMTLQGFLYCALWATYPAANQYIANPTEADLRSALTAMLICMCVGVGFFLATFIFFRRVLWYQVVLSILLSLIALSYEQLRDDMRHRYALVCMCGALALITVSLYVIERKNEAVLRKGLKIFSFSLLGIVAFQFAKTSLQYRRSIRQDVQPTLIVDGKFSGEAAGMPDIYYLVFDRYANVEVFKNEFDHDDEPLIAFLVDEGFFVKRNAFSNYAGTIFSLASTLNMQYLDFLPAKLGSNLRPLHHLIEDNQLVALLKNKGYLYYHFGSTWLTQHNRHADYDINPVTLTNNSFLDVLLNASIYPLINYYRTRTSKNSGFSETQLYHLDRISSLDILANRVEDTGPKFIFAHLLLPHYPYVFDRNGNVVPEHKFNDENADDYLEQAIYTRKRIIKLVSDIKKRSVNPPIIILQSDEGPKVEDVKTIKPRNALVMHGKILHAMYLPGVSEEETAHLLTPVNTFRFILNHYLGANLDLLENKAYISKSDKEYYNFVEVTSTLKKGYSPRP